MRQRGLAKAKREKNVSENKALFALGFIPKTFSSCQAIVRWCFRLLYRIVGWVNT